uniref:Uncharacterized protein n=1 Tax=Electrophorus electricus TaxID=8005 RepID=A0AAY5F5U8_ELEEL
QQSSKEQQLNPAPWANRAIQGSMCVKKYMGVKGFRRTVQLLVAHHDVSISVEELDEFLQTPETNDADDLHNSENQSAKRQRAHVIPEDLLQGREQGCGLVEGPVVRGEGPGQCALAQRDDEVHTPQEGEDVVDLQVKEVPLEQAILVILDEHAAGRGA